MTNSENHDSTVGLQDTDVEPAGYVELLEEVRAQVRAANVRAARRVNTELIVLYWRIGHLILARQAQHGWGARIVDRLSADLQAEFPGSRGWSRRSLLYMRRLAEAWPDSIVQQAAAQLPWTHIQVLLDRCKDQPTRDWYAAAAAHHGWSRAVLSHHLGSRLHERSGAAPDNFDLTHPDSDLAREVLRDPYRLDFLALDSDHTERQLEDALVAKLTHFLTELGEGFAFVGRQVQLRVGDDDFYIDLLFYHLGLRCYIVIELKADRPRPADVGQLSFYVTVVDDLIRRPDIDGPTIGILLAGAGNDLVVEYALRTTSAPVAVSTYQTHSDLPEPLRESLPAAADLVATWAGQQP